MNECVGLPTEDRRTLELCTAIHADWSAEVAKLKMQNLLYREALLDAGLEPPDRDAEDLVRMWDSCKAVIKAAHGALSELGTSKELLWPMR